MRNWSAMLGLATFLALPLPALAQEPNCDDAQTQAEMTGCASQDFDEADAALNAQYRKTRAAMREIDAAFEADQRGAEAALLKAQRAWVEYRDGQCVAYGFQAHMGTMEPMLLYQCQADLTRSRTKELKELAKGLGN